MRECRALAAIRRWHSFCSAVGARFTFARVYLMPVEDFLHAFMARSVLSRRVVAVIGLGLRPGN
jgi:hypothetical protein